MIRKNPTVKRLLQKVPTPLYLYDFSEIKKRISTIKKNFPKQTSLYYSMKANPNIGLIRAMSDKIQGIEVASYGELTAIFESNISINDVIFHGPAKCDESIRLAIHHEIKAIVIDSLNEIDRINAICEELDKSIDVLIRINPSFVPKGYKFSSSGPEHIKLGINEQEVPAAIEKIKKIHNHIKLIGFHCYLGSRQLNSNAYKYNAEQTVNLFKQYIHYIDGDVAHLAFASGIGATYYSDEQSFSFEGVHEFITNEINSLANSSGKKIEHILELGSYLLVDAGYYITQVVGLKKLTDYSVAITNGGINHNLSCIYRSTWEQRKTEDSHPIEAIQLTTSKNEKVLEYDIFGPICSEVDCLGKSILLPELQVGDFIAIGKSGAYCLTDSVVLFLSHGIPAEYLLDGDKAVQIKPAQPGVEYLRKTYEAITVV